MPFQGKQTSTGILSRHNAPQGQNIIAPDWVDESALRQWIERQAA